MPLKSAYLSAGAQQAKKSSQGGPTEAFKRALEAYQQLLPSQELGGKGQGQPGRAVQTSQPAGTGGQGSSRDPRLRVPLADAARQFDRSEFASPREHQPRQTGVSPPAPNPERVRWPANGLQAAETQHAFMSSSQSQSEAVRGTQQRPTVSTMPRAKGTDVAKPAEATSRDAGSAAEISNSRETARQDPTAKSAPGQNPRVSQFLASRDGHKAGSEAAALPSFRAPTAGNTGVEPPQGQAARGSLSHRGTSQAPWEAWQESLNKHNAASNFGSNPVLPQGSKGMQATRPGQRSSFPATEPVSKATPAPASRSEQSESLRRARPSPTPASMSEPFRANNCRQS